MNKPNLTILTANDRGLDLSKIGCQLFDMSSLLIQYSLPLTKTRREIKMMLSKLKTIIFPFAMLLPAAPGVPAAAQRQRA